MKAAKFLGLVLAAGLMLPAAAKAETVIRFSHVSAADTPKGKSAAHFAELVNERSNGEIKVEVYPSAQLYKDSEELDALQIGAVQMLAPSLGKFGPMGFRSFDVFSLPFLFDSTEQASKVLAGPTAKKLLEGLDERGIEGLAYWNNGFYVMTANQPLLNVDDFFGLRIRVQSSKISLATIKALGALPQTVSFSELYQALQTGVVDGADYPTLTNLDTQRICEVQKHITLSNHAYLGYAVVVNKEFWEGLPEDQRALLEQAMADTTEFNNNLVDQETAASLERIKATGNCEIHELTDEQLAEWKAATAGVRDIVAEEIGPEVLKDILAETGANAGE